MLTLNSWQQVAERAEKAYDYAIKPEHSALRVRNLGLKGWETFLNDGEFAKPSHSSIQFTLWESSLGRSMLSFWLSTFSSLFMRDLFPAEISTDHGQLC